MLRRSSVTQLLSLLAVALLSSCGGHDDPLRSYQNQTPDWRACAEERFSASDLKLAQKLGSRVSCADIRVPLDYANPAQGEIKVAVLRVQVAQAGGNNPAILINPGGPGEDGLSWPLRLSAYWSMDQITEDPAVVQSYQQLAQLYDLIGFSPRGTGWSTKLECLHRQDPIPVADPTRHLDEDNIDKTLFNSELIAQSCRDNPLMPHINTDATARDLDLIRHLLRQDKLNYIGLSYGTWLGNWYASLFPERVGRMLLSGVNDFSVPLSHQALPQDQGRQVVLDKVLIPYATRHPERFSLPVTASALRQMIDALPDPLHAAVVDALIDHNMLSNASMADSVVLTLRAAQVLHSELQANPGIDQVSLQARMANFDFVPMTPDATLNAIARTAAEDLVKRYFKPEIQIDDMFWSVVCNDRGTGFTPQGWVDQGNLNAKIYPDFGGSVRENACLYWRQPLIARPSRQRATQAGNILMLQATLDPLTVLPGAMNSLYLLPNASMILINDEITHALMPPYGTSCVDQPIAVYFLTGSLPPRTTSCQSRPLAADASSTQ